MPRTARIVRRTRLAFAARLRCRRRHQCLAEWFEIATGSEGATATLVDNVVAVGCVITGGEEGDRAGASVGVRMSSVPNDFATGA